MFHKFFLILLLLSFGSQSQAAESRFRRGKQLKSKKSTIVHSTKEHNLIKEDGKMVLYKKKNVVDFDGSLIEGDVKNPGEFYFVHRPEEKFGSLIKKRKNFHKEMLRDSVMIR